MEIKPIGDLSHLDKVNDMIAGAVRALLAQDFKYLSPRDREDIADWMKNDPLIRDLLAKGFEKVLS
jgi:hypothetical protein